LRENKVLNTDTLGVDTFEFDAIACPVNALRLVLHDLSDRISFAEVNRDSANTLGF
jgi:hypothetical protein